MEKEIKEIKEDLVKLSESMTRLTTAMIGDKLDQEGGYLNKIDTNAESIEANKDEIIKLKGRINTSWSKIGIASGAGVGLGGVGASKGGVILSKLIEFLT